MGAETLRPSYPDWEDVQEKLYETLRSIVSGTGFCPEQIDKDDLLHESFLRLRRYYTSGIQKGNIRKFASWCGVKSWSAARDARRHMLRTRGLEGRVQHIPLEIERGEGDSEELPEAHTAREYKSKTLDEVRLGAQNVVRKILIDHAEKDPESVAVILLYDCEDVPAVEIAAMRNKSENVIRDIVYKDRKVFEQQLAEQGVTDLRDIL
jgi:DNA-directed RNA polymerase specialized sigma24 family protein